jgi:hypothetical protein
MASKAGISLGSCHNILTCNLNIHYIAAKSVPCLLTDKQKQDHVAGMRARSHSGKTSQRPTVSIGHFLFHEDATEWTRSGDITIHKQSGCTGKAETQDF